MILSAPPGCPTCAAGLPLALPPFSPDALDPALPAAPSLCACLHPDNTNQASASLFHVIEGRVVAGCRY